MTRIVARMQTIFRSRFYSSGEASVVMITQELHATKGWRLLQTRRGKTTDRRMPLEHREFVRMHKKPRTQQRRIVCP